MEVSLKRLTKNGAFANEVLFLNQQKTYSVGRISTNDVVLFAPTVAKHHCIFHHNSNGLFCEVLKSLAGVVVNDKKYTTGSMVQLQNNDLLHIGLLFKYQVEIKPIVQNFHIKTNFTSDYENDYERIKTEDPSHVNIKKELELEDATIDKDAHYEENWGARRGIESFNSEVSTEIKEEFTLQKETQEISLKKETQEISLKKETQEISFDEIHLSMQITIDEEDLKPLFPLNSSGETVTDPKNIPEISREPETLKLAEFANVVREKSRLRRFRRIKKGILEKSCNETFENKVSENPTLSNEQNETFLKENETSFVESLTDPKTIVEISREPGILKLSESPNLVKETRFRRCRRMNNRILRIPKEKKISSKENETEFVNKFDTNFVQQHGIDSVKNLPMEFASSLPEINFSSHEKSKKLESLKPKIPEEIECSPFARKMKKFEEEKRLPEKRLFVTLIDILKNPISDFPSMMKLPSDLENLNEKPKPTKNGRKSHEEKVFKCKFCAKQLSSKIYLINHEKLHISERPYRCEKCGMDFTKSSRLKSHWETHNELRLFTCAICEMTFKSKVDVKHHLTIHTGVNRRTCGICKKILARKTTLERHMKTHDSTSYVRQDNTRKAFHECKECYRIFRFRCELEEHIRSHKGERPFVCQVCKRTFPGKKTLWSHKRSHLLRKYNCNDCTKQFSRKGNLRVHMVKHMKSLSLSNQ